MGIETILALSAVAGGLTTGVSIFQSREQNRAIGKAEEANKKAAEVQTGQLKAQADQERLVRQREAAQIRGRIRAMQAAAGLSTDNTNDQLIRQATIDEQFGLNTIDANLGGQLDRVRSGLDVTLSELSSRKSNPLIAGLSGGLQGLSTGLSIAGGGLAIRRELAAPVQTIPPILPFRR